MIWWGAIATAFGCRQVSMGHFALSVPILKTNSKLFSHLPIFHAFSNYFRISQSPFSYLFIFRPMQLFWWYCLWALWEVNFSRMVLPKKMYEITTVEIWQHFPWWSIRRSTLLTLTCVPRYKFVPLLPVLFLPKC